MEANRKQTIEAMANSEERQDKCHIEILEFEAKKHKDNTILYCWSLDMQIANNAKIIEIEKEKMAATKKTNKGFVHALLSIRKAMARICENL